MTCEMFKLVALHVFDIQKDLQDLARSANIYGGAQIGVTDVCACVQKPSASIVFPL